jgi:hypothetical protein
LWFEGTNIARTIWTDGLLSRTAYSKAQHLSITQHTEPEFSPAVDHRPSLQTSSSMATDAIPIQTHYTSMDFSSSSHAGSQDNLLPRAKQGIVGSAGEAPRETHQISGDAAPRVTRRAAPGQRRTAGLRGGCPRQEGR